MTRALIALELIDPNPYQPRQSEDPELVERMAQSIVKDGLLQPPAARQVNGRYELAFGHTRLAAFRKLDKVYGEEGFQEMPLELADLDDEAMYRHAVVENLQRKDLNVIDEANAMKRAMADFGYNSRQVGELFGKSDVTVRGLIRFLELPADIQDKLANGEISQNDARKLLTLKRVSPDSIQEVAEKMTSAVDSDAVIVEAMFAADEKKIVQMWKGYYSAAREVRGGEGLWPLNWNEFTHLPPLSVKEAIKGLELEEAFSNPEKQADLHDWILQLEHDPNSRVHLLADDVPADLIDRLAHLIDPPACTQCPFMARSRGEYYCGSKLCYARKKKGWIDGELARLSDELGIPVYDMKQDGKDTVDLSGWDADDKALFKSRDEQLRLKGSPRSYNNDLTDNPTVKVVLTGERAKKIKEAARKQREEHNARYSYDPEQWERRRVVRAANEKRLNAFVIAHAIPQFMLVFENIDSFPVLEYLAENARRWLSDGQPGENAHKSTKMTYCRRVLAYDLILTNLPYNDWLDEEEGAIEEKAAKHLQGVAKTFGVKLPSDFSKKAAEYATDGLEDE